MGNSEAQGRNFLLRHSEASLLLSTAYQTWVTALQTRVFHFLTKPGDVPASPHNTNFHVSIYLVYTCLSQCCAQQESSALSTDFSLLLAWHLSQCGTIHRHHCAQEGQHSRKLWFMLFHSPLSISLHLEIPTKYFSAFHYLFHWFKSFHYLHCWPQCSWFIIRI